MFLPLADCKKIPRQEKPSVGSSISRGEVIQGKPGDASMACAERHCSGNTQRSLCTQESAILRSV